MRKLLGVCAAVAALAMVIPAVASAQAPLTKTRAQRHVVARAVAAYRYMVTGKASAASCGRATGGRFICRYELTGAAGKRMLGQASVWRTHGRLRSRVARPAAVTHITLVQAKPAAEQAVSVRHPNGKALVGCTSVTKSQTLNGREVTCKYVVQLSDGDRRSGTVKIKVEQDGVASAVAAPAGRTEADAERMFALKSGVDQSAVNCDDLESFDDTVNGHTLDCDATLSQAPYYLSGKAAVSADGTITVQVTPPAPAPSTTSSGSYGSYVPGYYSGSTYVPGYYVPGTYIPGEYVSGVGYIPGSYVPGFYVPGGYY